MALDPSNNSNLEQLALKGLTSPLQCMVAQCSNIRSMILLHRIIHRVQVRTAVGGDVSVPNVFRPHSSYSTVDSVPTVST